MRAFNRFGTFLRNKGCHKPSRFRWFSVEGTNSSPFYDVIIVGGGMVGSTLACALGKCFTSCHEVPTMTMIK